MITYETLDLMIGSCMLLLAILSYIEKRLSKM